MVILGPLTYMGGYWQAAMEAGQAGGQLPFGTTLMWAVIGFVVFAIVQAFPLNASGQTWGKKLLKIKIVDLDGGKPTLGRLLGMRYLPVQRSEEHTSELQSLMRISYAVFCLKKKKNKYTTT